MNPGRKGRRRQGSQRRGGRSQINCRPLVLPVTWQRPYGRGGLREGLHNLAASARGGRLRLRDGTSSLRLVVVVFFGVGEAEPHKHLLACPRHNSSLPLA